MMFRNILLFSLISACLILLTGCKEKEEEEPIVDHSWLGHYWLDNQTSFDLFIESGLKESYGDTLLIEVDDAIEFDQRLGFLTFAEPWEELTSFTVWRLRNDSMILAYGYEVPPDSLWRQEQIVGANNATEFKYTLRLTDQLIK